jgi:hypothetical protein
MRLLIAFFIGVAATLGWQSYGNTAREMIANSSPQLGWLAPQDAVPTASATTAPTASSLDSEELKELSASLATLGQKVDQLAAGQEQMARDLTAKLRASEQDILDKISVPPSQPAAAPVRRPAPPPVQVAPAR